MSQTNRRLLGRPVAPAAPAPAPAAPAAAPGSPAPGSPAPGSPAPARRGLPAALVLCAVAYGLYVTGFNVARRDAQLPGDLLYLARIVQLVTFFVAAFLLRDHLPNVRRLFTAGSAVLAVHLALSLVASGVPWAQVASHALSGVANAVFVLLLAHFLSTYGPALSSVGILAGFLIKEVLFAWTSLWPQGWVVAGQVWMRLAAVVVLAAAAWIKRDVEPTQSEHPLQYGVPVVAGAQRHPFAYLLNGADWTFQLIAAALTPFVFGFMSQALSTGSLSDGLHDPVSEVAAVAVLAALLAICVRAGSRVTFLDMFVPTVLLDTLGLALLPLTWTGGSPLPGIMLKCAEVVNESLLWVLLARKAFEDPRHTYLYFGVFFGVWNVTYGRLAAPLVIGRGPVDAAFICGACVVFLAAFVCVCLLLFVLQRLGVAGGAALRPDETTCGRDDESGPQTAGGPAAAFEGPDVSFLREMGAFVERVELTPREREVLLETLHGYSMPNIAARLGISTGTVRTHMRNIYQKAGVTNKQELIQLLDRRAGSNGAHSEP